MEVINRVCVVIGYVGMNSQDWSFWAWNVVLLRSTMRTCRQSHSSMGWLSTSFLAQLLPWFGRARMLLPLVGRLLELQTHLTLLLAPSVVTLLLTLAGNISNFFLHSGCSFRKAFKLVFWLYRNVIHGSDSVGSARKEIALWFPEGPVAWSSSLNHWIYE